MDTATATMTPPQALAAAAAAAKPAPVSRRVKKTATSASHKSGARRSLFKKPATKTPARKYGASEQSVSVAKAKRRRKPHTAALMAIRRCQKNSTVFSIPRAAMGRYVREIAQEYAYDLRFTRNAMEAIQEAAEGHLIDRLKASYAVTITAGREFLLLRDMVAVANVLAIKECGHSTYETLPQFGSDRQHAEAMMRASAAKPTKKA